MLSSSLLALLPLISSVAATDIYYFQDGTCSNPWKFGCTNLPELVCCDIPVIRTPSVLVSSMPDGASAATYSAIDGYNCPGSGHSSKLEDQGKGSGGSLCLNAGGLSVAGAQWFTAADAKMIKRDGSMPTRGSMQPNVATVDGHHFRINYGVPDDVTQTILEAVENRTLHKDIPKHCHKHAFNPDSE